MAMQSGNAVPEKVHGRDSAEKTGDQNRGHGHGGQWWGHHHPQQQQQQQQLVIDERDGFISWLRGEFAAANAIIDSLCHHLRAIGEPGEYDGVIGCIQQRRCNWNPVLHMQQYFSVAEVIYTLQQAGWRRQQRGFERNVKVGKEFRRGGRGQRGGEAVKDGGGKEAPAGDPLSGSSKETNGNVKIDERVVEVKKVTRLEVDDSIKTSEKVQVDITGDSDCKAESVDDKCGTCDFENDSTAIQGSHEKQNLTVAPKTFVATELFDKDMVNVVDGMDLYENLFEDKEVSELVTLVNDLRAVGRRGKFQGQTFVVSKRPMKGHGREMIQLGIPVADAPPEDEAGAWTSKGKKIEPIPGFLQDVIERLNTKQVTKIKPDSCIIDVFNEGDYSQPHMWPHSFGRPITVLFLTECEMTFGKVIGADHPGEYRGSFKISLAPGSILVLQGRSTDFAKHAISSEKKQRILVTFTKSQPKQITHGDIHRFPSSGVSPLTNWVPPLSRSPNHISHPPRPKHYGPVPTTGILPSPIAHPQLPPPNGMQPVFIPAPVAPAVPFAAPMPLPPASGGWPGAPPRHPPSRLPVPGTGVFLPPGSGNSSAAEDVTTETLSSSEKENGAGKLNRISTPPKCKDGNVQLQDCNGSTDGSAEGRVLPKKEHHQTADSKVAGTPHSS